MSNRYTSPNVSIVPGVGTMYNEATTYNNNHYSRTTSMNDNTYKVSSYTNYIPKRRKTNKRKRKSR